MNYWLFSLINDMANQSFVLDALMIVISKVVPYIYIFILAGLYMQGFRTRNFKLRGESFATGVLFLICLLGSFILGSMFYENRPFVDHTVVLIVNHAADASFPSDHAVGTMALACGILYYRWNLGTWMVYGSILVGISRVFVGNHYPGDILGAFILVWILTALYNKLLRRGVVRVYKGLDRRLMHAYMKRFQPEERY
ncbi:MULTISPECIES: phosphatase PAP2 family protein [unclassified Veillonella]|uniref:phosphatase PAP2 family protein n=1 Tax=unclassified Veillonella TaxID=2630086 RepID=UPI00021A2A2A|nr:MULTISPECIES: phosphatase PAP2 family protein [unclassified Veillonella]EGS35589.1 PAP2 family protein [Veillonella sp. oral taxon 780 str. F0422]